MKRRTFLKAVFPTIFAPQLIVPVWKTIKPVHYKWNVYLPQVHRVFPEILASELVSVQPMTGPSSQIFYLDFVTTSRSDDDRFGIFD